MKNISLLGLCGLLSFVCASNLSAQEGADVSVAPQAREFVLPDDAPVAKVSAPSVLQEPVVAVKPQPRRAKKTTKRRSSKKVDTTRLAAYETTVAVVVEPEVIHTDLLPQESLQAVAVPAQSMAAMELLAQAPNQAVSAQADMPMMQEQMPGPGAGDGRMMPSSPADVAGSAGFDVRRSEGPAAGARAASVRSMPKVVYAPQSKRDPTLSPDEVLLVKFYQAERLKREEADRQRRLEAERKRAKELERLRQLELARLKDPTMEVRGRFKVGGIIGQEVFIGSRIYTVGKSIYGAKIVKVLPESVIFMYKGHKFTKKVEL